MGFYNPEFDEKRRVEQKPYTKYQIGKSREQGTQGSTQGSQGWMAQYQPMLDAITKGSQLPKLKQHSAQVGTQDWMNEALGNVQIHNLQKMAMQRNRALSNLLGGAMRADAQMRTSALANATRERLAAIDAVTRKYRIDKNYDYRKQALDEQRGYHKTMGDYYKGLIQNQQQRAAIDLYKAQHPKNQGTKQLNPLDAANKRMKLVKDQDTFLKGVYGEDVFDQMGDVEKAKAIVSFISTGKLPKYSVKENGPLIPNELVPGGGVFDPFRGAAEQQAQQQGNAAKQEMEKAKKITKEHIGSIQNEIAKDYGVSANDIVFDPKRKMYLLPGGKGVPLDAAYSLVYGG